MHFIGNAGKGVFEALLNEGYREVRDVYAYPFPAELLRGMYARAASAERIE
jgi:hypothetical protein